MTISSVIEKEDYNSILEDLLAGYKYYDYDVITFGLKVNLNVWSSNKYNLFKMFGNKMILHSEWEESAESEILNYFNMVKQELDFIEYEYMKKTDRFRSELQAVINRIVLEERGRECYYSKGLIHVPGEFHYNEPVSENSSFCNKLFEQLEQEWIDEYAAASVTAFKSSLGGAAWHKLEAQICENQKYDSFLKNIIDFSFSYENKAIETRYFTPELRILLGEEKVNELISKNKISVREGSRATKAIANFFPKGFKNLSKVLDSYSVMKDMIKNKAFEEKEFSRIALSIDPRDFFTMSLSDSWSSCQTPDGDYSNGILSLMKDKCTAVAYREIKVNNKICRYYAGFSSTDKEWRRLVHLNPDHATILLNREYPRRRANDTKNLLNLITQNVEPFKSAECDFDLHPLYDLPNGDNIYSVSEDSCHYNDISRGNKPEIFLPKGHADSLTCFEIFEIGASAICLSCGQDLVDLESRPYCYGCDEGSGYCDCCEDSCRTDETAEFYIAGEGYRSLCNYCLENYYFFCEYCDSCMHIDSVSDDDLADCCYESLHGVPRKTECDEDDEEREAVA